jgi:hypothetical protein
MPLRNGAHSLFIPVDIEWAFSRTLSRERTYGRFVLRSAVSLELFQLRLTRSLIPIGCTAIPRTKKQNSRTENVGGDVLVRKSPICRYGGSIPQRRRNAAYAFAVDASTSKRVTNHTCSSSLVRCGTANTVTSTLAVGLRFRRIVHSSATVSAPTLRRSFIPLLGRARTT